METYNNSTKKHENYDYETFKIQDLQFFPSSILAKRSFNDDKGEREKIEEREREISHWNQSALNSYSASPSETFYIQFDSMNKRFIIESIENTSLSKELSFDSTLLMDGIVTNAFTVPNLTPNSNSVTITSSKEMEKHETKGKKSKIGRSLIGTRMIVEDLSTGKHEEFLDPIIRLYYDPINKHLTGGLLFDNQWYQIQDLIHDKNDQFHNSINANNANNSTSMMIKIKKIPPFKCAHDQTKFNKQGALDFHADKLLQSRNKNSNSNKNKRLETRLADETKSLESLAGATGGCPGYRKAIYIGVVADCHFLKKYGGDQSKALAAIIGEFNIVSGIFERNLNIEIGIGSVDIMRECGDNDNARIDNSSSSSPSPSIQKNNSNNNSAKSKWNSPKCDSSYSMDERLSDFSKWRGDKKDDSLGLYHLMSGCSGFDVVGIAWLNQVCQTKATWSLGEYVSGTSVSLSVPNRAAVIAHEMGHNFGASHDCDKMSCALCDNGRDERECKCCPCIDNADGGKCDCKSNYLMNPESGGLPIQNFSLCTKKDICGKLPVLAGCLEKPGSHRSISKSICGNGIREEGEECDCGDQCDSDICCQEDCKLKPKAQCSFRNDDCCTEKCQITPLKSNKQCRKRENDCQMDAYCNGKSSICPEERFLPDGTECFDLGGMGSGSKNDNENDKRMKSEKLVKSPFESSDRKRKEGGNEEKASFVYQCASGICTNRDLQCQAIGLRSGIKSSCPWNVYECKITCSASSYYSSSSSSSSSLFSNNVNCVTFESYFVNGTKCGKNGSCHNGKCSVSEWSEFFKESNSLIWIIGLVGGVIIAILFIGCVNWLVRRINK